MNLEKLEQWIIMLLIFKTNKMEIKQTFTIDCNTWRCGGSNFKTNDEKDLNSLGEGSTALLNTKGYMCCLGQIAIQLGVNKDALMMVGEPQEVESDDIIGLLVQKDWYGDSNEEINHNTSLSSDAMYINDDINTTVATKMNELKQLFNNNNIGLEFINIPTHAK